MKKLLLSFIIILISNNILLYSAQNFKRDFLEDSINKRAFSEFEKLNDKQRKIVFKRLKDLLSLVHIQNEKHDSEQRQEINNLERKFAKTLMGLINESYKKCLPFFLENVTNIPKVNNNDYNPFDDQAWICEESKSQVRDINQNLFDMYEYFAKRDPMTAQNFLLHDKKVESIGYSRLVI